MDNVLSGCLGPAVPCSPVQHHAFFTLLFLAAYRLPVPWPAPLGATLPLILLLLSWALDRQRPALRWLLPALLGLTGVMLLLDPGARLDTTGVLCALGATVLIALSARWMQPGS